MKRILPLGLCALTWAAQELRLMRDEIALTPRFWLARTGGKR